MLIVEEKVLNGRIYVHQLRRGSQRHFNFFRRNCVLLKRMGRIINYTRRSVTKVKFRSRDASNADLVPTPDKGKSEILQKVVRFYFFFPDQD